MPGYALDNILKVYNSETFNTGHDQIYSSGTFNSGHDKIYNSGTFNTGHDKIYNKSPEFRQQFY